MDNADNQRPTEQPDLSYLDYVPGDLLDGTLQLGKTLQHWFHTERKKLCDEEERRLQRQRPGAPTRQAVWCPLALSVRQMSHNPNTIDISWQCVYMRPKGAKRLPGRKGTTYITKQKDGNYSWAKLNAKATDIDLMLVRTAETEAAKLRALHKASGQVRRGLATIQNLLGSLDPEIFGGGSGDTWLRVYATPEPRVPPPPLGAEYEMVPHDPNAPKVDWGAIYDPRPEWPLGPGWKQPSIW